MDSIFDLDHLYRTYFKMALPSVFGLMAVSYTHLTLPTKLEV